MGDFLAREQERAAQEAHDRALEKPPLREAIVSSGRMVPEAAALWDRAIGPCPTCALHGILNCRETVATCDLCGLSKDVFMDYSESGDREKPDETVCLDCLDGGAHIKAAHPAKEA